MYCGRSDDPYVQTLGAGLDARIELFWDGPTVWCRELEASDAANFVSKVGRPPVVFVRDGKARVVVRRETYDDLLALDA